MRTRLRGRKNCMDVTTALTIITQAGFGGIAIWQGQTSSQWMGCFMSTEGPPLTNTVLWDYRSTPEDVVTALVRKAEGR